MNYAGVAGAFSVNPAYRSLHNVACARYSIRAMIRAQWRGDGRWLDGARDYHLGERVRAMQAELLIERIKGIPLIRLPSLCDPVKQNKAVSLTASLIDVMLQ